MKVKTAKLVQKNLWHFRWLLLTGLMIYNLYCLNFAFEMSSFLPINGLVSALYFFVGMWERYFNCISSCKI
jgi:hypothetical protein